MAPNALPNIPMQLSLNIKLCAYNAMPSSDPNHSVVNRFFSI